MQKNKSIIIVRVIAIFTTLTALNSLIPISITIGVPWLLFTTFLQGHVSGGNYGWFFLFFLFIYLIIILKIISAYGLFRIRIWGRKLAIVVLATDFINQVYKVINGWLYFFGYLKSSIPELEPYSPTTVIAKFISMWPIYLLASISLISIIILLLKPIKKVFSKKSISKPDNNFA